MPPLCSVILMPIVLQHNQLKLKFSMHVPILAASSYISHNTSYKQTDDGTVMESNIFQLTHLQMG